ncbi:hypothetical protein [Bacteroides sp.]|uniref:hypothetical protein n=1 Tax=Bacteroides sp. TaxID=29523 RepID=UPI002589763B|nr:hypothetical protein [Bacteroides sp.]
MNHLNRTLVLRTALDMQYLDYGTSVASSLRAQNNTTSSISSCTALCTSCCCCCCC